MSRYTKRKNRFDEYDRLIKNIDGEIDFNPEIIRNRVLNQITNE